MRNCFEQLKKELPKGQEEKKTSNLSILSSALNFITVSGEREGVNVANELRNRLSASLLPNGPNTCRRRSGRTRSRSMNWVGW